MVTSCSRPSVAMAEGEAARVFLATYHTVGFGRRVRMQRASSTGNKELIAEPRTDRSDSTPFFLWIL